MIVDIETHKHLVNKAKLSNTGFIALFTFLLGISIGGAIASTIAIKFVNSKNIEINRLHNLCTKNNINSF